MPGCVIAPLCGKRDQHLLLHAPEGMTAARIKGFPEQMDSIIILSFSPRGVAPSYHLVIGLRSIPAPG